MSKIGNILVRIAIGLFLCVSGIVLFTNGGKYDITASAIRQLTDVFDSDVITNILIYVYGGIELLCGAFILISLITGEQFKKINSLFMLIVIIVWIITMVLCDFLGNNGFFNAVKEGHLLSWILYFVNHLIILGSLLVMRD